MLSDNLRLRARDRRALPQVVRESLEDLIRDGHFPPGSRLPGEDDLAALFDVSRPTLRDAMKSLEAAGVVSRRRGVGTFVTDRGVVRNSLDVNFSFSDLVAAHGRQPGVRDLHVDKVPASGEDAGLLQVAPGDPLVSISRVRTADGEAVGRTVDLVPVTLLPEGHTYAGASIYDFLRKAGHEVHHGDARIEPVAADAELAALLGVARRSPLLFLDQVDHDQDGRPLLRSLEWHLPAAFEFRVYRQGPSGPLSGGQGLSGPLSGGQAKRGTGKG